MWGGGNVHGLSGLGLPFGPGRLPPPRALDGALGEGSMEPEQFLQKQKWKFPLKAGLTAGSLILTGDTGAQFYERYRNIRSLRKSSSLKSIVTDGSFWQHDLVRSLRMGSYAFLLYGPLTDSWYRLLDRKLPAKNLATYCQKVVLHQSILGPTVISIVFAWNALWQGRIRNYFNIYRYNAIPAMKYGWSFWTPMSFINFSIVPLEARVAFMSTCAICWNFYLSSVVSQQAPVNESVPPLQIRHNNTERSPVAFCDDVTKDDNDHLCLEPSRGHQN